MLLKDKLGNKDVTKFKMKTSIDEVDNIKKFELEHFLKCFRLTEGQYNEINEI